MPDEPPQLKTAVPQARRLSPERQLEIETRVQRRIEAKTVADALRALGLFAFAFGVGAGRDTPADGVAHIEAEIAGGNRTPGWKSTAGSVLARLEREVGRR